MKKRIKLLDFIIKETEEEIIKTEETIKKINSEEHPQVFQYYKGKYDGLMLAKATLTGAKSALEYYI